MLRVTAINGSPRMERGFTDLMLNSFMKGMMESGAEVLKFYANRLKLKPCAGEMYCWYENPGECYLNDGMDRIYPRLRESNILVLATPVYIPLPGCMQVFINRLCPLIKPFLETRNGRTRTRFKDDVKIEKVVLVSTGGWWEKQNFATVVRIGVEFAENAGIEFTGALLRPHAFLMKKKGKLTENGQIVVNAAKRAGSELITEGSIKKETLDKISQPLISREGLIEFYNSEIK